MLTVIRKTAAVLLIVLSRLRLAASQTNYATNGQFEQPLITADVLNVSSILGFHGSFNRLAGADGFLNHSYIHLPQNQSISTTIQLPSLGKYNLSLDIFSQDGNTKAHKLFLRWNSGKNLTFSSNLIAQAKTVIQLVDGIVGPNTLTITEAGNSNKLGLLAGSRFDNLVVWSDFVIEPIVPVIPIVPVAPITPVAPIIPADDATIIITKPIKSIQSALIKQMSLPSTQIQGIKFLALFIDDLWLYVYDNRNYTGYVQLIFQTVIQIQKVKWTFFNYADNLNLPYQSLHLSNYSQFSNQKHLKVDGVDDCVLKNLFNYFVFTIPQTFIFICVCFRLFMCSADYRISILLRKFYFGGALVQILMESNTAYFTYVSLNQFKILFSFTLKDRLALAFAVLFFFFVLVNALCFYFAVSRLYVKKCGYFLQAFYRCRESLVLLTILVGVRGLLKGFIHHFYHYQYQMEIVSICLLQSFIICLAIGYQNFYRVFVTKTKFVIAILCRMNFVLLNISFLVEYFYQRQHEGAMLNEFQSYCLISQMALIVLLMVVEFIPQNWFRRRKTIDFFLQECSSHQTEPEQEQIGPFPMNAKNVTSFKPFKSFPTFSIEEQKKVKEFQVSKDQNPKGKLAEIANKNISRRPSVRVKFTNINDEREIKEINAQFRQNQIGSSSRQ